MSPRMLRTSAILLFVLCSGAVAASIGALSYAFLGPPHSALYRSVHDEPPKAFLDALREDALEHDELERFIVLDDKPGESFVVRDDELFLDQHPEPNQPIDLFRRPRWTIKRIRLLREAHPELEPYWPAPERPDGGVQWVVDNDVPDREPRRP